MKKRYVNALAVSVILASNALQSNIFLIKIVNQTKNKAFIKIPPIGRDRVCIDPIHIDPIFILPKKFYSFPKHKIVDIQNDLTEKMPMVITTNEEKYKLYYGKDKTNEPCICIKNSSDMIHHQRTIDPNECPFVKLILMDEGKLPEIKITNLNLLKSSALFSGKFNKFCLRAMLSL